MKFKADEIASVIQKEIEQFESRVDVREVGRVKCSHERRLGRIRLVRRIVRRLSEV